MMNRLLRQSTLINRCFPILPKILNVGFFYQSFYYTANTHSILPNKETNTPAISFDKTSQFLTISNHSKTIISIGTKRWVATKTPSPPQTYLRLPKNRKEEIQFLHDFLLAEQSVIQRTLMELMRALPIENRQFSSEFCGKLRDILTEWLITGKGTRAIARTIKILHDHGYLKVSVDFHLSIRVLIWMELNELNEMKDEQYFIFISTLPYLCLKLNRLPTNREEEVKFLEDFQSANDSVNALKDLQRAAKNRNHSSATKPSVAGLILYGLCKTNYICKIPQRVIRDCFNVWYDGMANLAFEQLTFPRYALCEMYPDFKLKPTDIIPEFGPHFWKEIERRLDQNEVDREKHIFYLLKAHLVFNDVPINLLNRLLLLTKVIESAEGAANMLWLYGRLSEYKEVEIPNDLLRDCFKIWYDGIVYLPFEQLSFSRYALCKIYSDFKLKPIDIIPEFGPDFWKEIDRRLDQNEVKREKNIFYLIKAHIVFNDVPIN